MQHGRLVFLPIPLVYQHPLDTISIWWTLNQENSSHMPREAPMQPVVSSIECCLDFFLWKSSNTERWTGMCSTKTVFLEGICWNVSWTGSYPCEAVSGVPRILEWEGSRRRRRRGGWGVGMGGYPSPLGEGSMEEAVPPSHKIFRIFCCWKYHILTVSDVYFLNDANGRGSNPLTPSSVRHWKQCLQFLQYATCCVSNSQASAVRLSSWTDSSSAPLLSFSSSNFTNLWSSNWRFCASFSNRRWLEVHSDWNLVRNSQNKFAAPRIKWSRAIVIFPSCVLAAICFYMLLSFMDAVCSVFKKYLSKHFQFTIILSQSTPTDNYLLLTNRLNAFFSRFIPVLYLPAKYM